MRRRKSYPKYLKTQVVQECEQPGVSVAVIAMRHGVSTPMSFAGGYCFTVISRQSRCQLSIL
ncbi:transposase [Pseudomonas sp. GM21]|uniref:transposase n=1 Tax=Pseudomonas sp. GM21 TaxID=1144325 RepID=UPI0002725304|nr:transposase [Pseudomonas sp. GM21]